MIRSFKKAIWNESDWETITFYELKQDYKIIQWCQKHYGKSLHTKWYPTFSGIVMNEKIYIHWKLIE